MAKKAVTSSIIEMYTCRNIVMRFGNKWGIAVIVLLGEHKIMRFGKIKELIHGISSKVLSSTLQSLENDGLISRTVYQESPIRVEYQLTESGLSLLPVIFQLSEWAMKNMPKQGTPQVPDNPEI